MTGHWLMKKTQVSADRTWADLGIAFAWLTKEYEENPPFIRADRLQAYSSLENKLEYATDVLPRGVDVSWAYYTPSKNLISFSVVPARTDSTRTSLAHSRRRKEPTQCRSASYSLTRAGPPS
ncbi:MULTISPECIES: hypothetical protein [unclassified Streptomyces]|uniref:hypothetical protein n=1 Tax=unclassified Streptomyces TaxID=2593676 RepID=UPI00386DD08B|nr:hypothetical protein OG331_05090 [Streptomyces sp. NBC_01017]